MRKIILLYGVLFFTATYQLAMAQTAAQYLKKSDDYWSMGRFDSALKYAWLAEPLVADSTTRNSKEYSYFMGQYFSMNHEAAGNTDSASYWYRFSLNMFESLKDTASNEYGETLVNYGNMLISQSYYNDAQPYLQKSVVVMQNHQENVNGYLASLNNLGNYYNYCGEYSNAIALYHKCLDSLERQPIQISYLSQTAILLQNLATLNAKIGNIKEAELYYEKASVFFKKTQNLYGYYEARKNLGNLYISLKNKLKAEKIFTELYNDSLLNRHTGSNPNDKLSWEYAEAITGLGEVRELYGLYKDAENLYQKSMAIANMLSEKRGVISSQSCMAHLYSITNRRLAADSLYENLFVQLLKKNTYDYFSYFTAYTYYCENLVMLNQLPKAFEKVKYISELLFTDLQNNFPGMTEDDQINYLVSLNNYKNLLATIAAGQQAGANEIVNYALNRLLQLKGIILTYQQRRLQSIRHSQDEALTKLAENWISIKIKLYKSYTSGANATITNHLETLASRYNQEIAAKTGISLQAINSFLTDTISNRLLPGEAAIEFFRYRQGEGTESNYGAFVLRHTAPPLFVKLCTESRLKECFKTTFFNKFNTEHQLKNGQLIYDLVWKPLWQQMNKTDKVYYSPAGLLNYISFDALPGATPNSSLLQEVNLVRLSSIRNLPEAVYSQNETPSTAVLWGNIDCSERAYSSPAFSYKAPDADNLPASLASSVKGSPGAKGFDPLKNDELPVVRAIMQRKRIPVSVYESLNATEENFKQNAAAFSGWLHISSHGFYAGNPADTGAQPQYTNRFTTPLNPLLRCGLILNGANWSWSGKTLLPSREDGILTGYEIAMMDLSKVKLVVLSACETGLGDIDAGSEGVLGLQRAFRLAGVNKMVISLWNVNAKATEELMAAFYQEMTAGRSPAVALRNAKLQMAKAQIRATGKNLPYDWAGFVLVE